LGDATENVAVQFHSTSVNNVMQRINLAGQVFGQLTIHQLVRRSPRGQPYWSGTCSCGRPVVKRGDHLKPGTNHSCGRCRAATASPSSPAPATGDEPSRESPVNTAPPPQSQSSPLSLEARIEALENTTRQILMQLEAITQFLHPETTDPSIIPKPESRECDIQPAVATTTEGAYLDDCQELSAAMRAFLERGGWVPDGRTSQPAESAVNGNSEPSHSNGETSLPAGTVEPNGHPLRDVPMLPPMPPNGHTAPDPNRPNHTQAFLRRRGKLLTLGSYPDAQQAEFIMAYATMLQKTLITMQGLQQTIEPTPVQIARFKTLWEQSSVNDATKIDLIEDAEIQLLETGQKMGWPTLSS
jgi:hypothetical protein